MTTNSEHIAFLQDRISTRSRQWDEYIASGPVGDESFDAKQQEFSDWMDRASDALDSMIREEATINRGNVS